MSIPSAMHGGSGALDERRLRAGLRLFLPAGRAELAAEHILSSDDSLAALNQLAGDLTRERYLSRIVGRLPLANRIVRSQSPVQMPDTVSIRSMLTLLVHVGCDIDGERLEDAFGADSQELGLDLLNARSTFGAGPITACCEFGWLVGRYRDRGLASEERLRLLSHARNCDLCSAAIDQAQQADATLLASIERELQRLPEHGVSASTARRNRRLGPVALAAGLVAVVLAVVVAVTAIDRLISPPASPVPLFTGEATTVAPLDGWLLQVSPVGYLEGVNLATGHKRGLDSGDATGNFSPLYRVSRTHVAAWRPSDGQRDDVLTIGPIGEQFDFRLTWNRQFVYWYPSGWLDDDTLLIVKSPEHISGELEAQYIERLARDSRLIAFDAVTGDEQVLMTGNVAAAYPSPDGTMLAILHPVDRRWPGNTIELRPFDGQAVGEPVVVIEHRVAGEGFWLADNSSFVTTVITDEAITMVESGRRRNLAEYGVLGVALDAIARDGSRTTLAAVETPDTIVPLTVSPDGKSIVYQVQSEQRESEFAGVQAYDWQCYRIPTNGGEPTLLTSGSSPERIYRPAWSPDGGTLVIPVARAFPLSTDGQIDQPANPNATTLLIFDPGWQPGAEPRAIYSGGRDLYGWLQPDAIDARAGVPGTAGRSLAAVEASEEEFEDIAIGSGSVADRTGSYLVADDRGSRRPLIWNVAGQRQRQLPAGTTEISWFNQGTATIGVKSGGDGAVGSRIVLNVADISRSVAYLDHRYFDPANLGDASELRYSLPLVSPSGTTVSFFVVDRDAGIATLWLDHATEPATTVATWSFPADPAIEPAFVATWVSADTLLFARPDDWQDGMPRTSVLSRVILARTGGAQVDELVRLDATRGAEGVALVDLALSTDRTLLAYRLRHYESWSDAGDSNDTLHVAGTDDLGQAIELERGGYGERLAWTTSGNGIIAGVRGRIALYSPDGRDLEYLSPRHVQSSNPILVGTQVWFEAHDDDGSSIWRVDLDE
ncbi:MAG TPA: hypothetical protein VEX37_14355 [Thermomicrobiales bacterium]|nr:hypothetical protein [Thermomicrobiales bacterium]